MSAPLSNEATFRRTLRQAIALPLVALVLLAGVFLAQTLHLLTLTEWIDHSDRVIAAAIDQQKLLVDMETGVRGYLLTGERDFLQPYSEAEVLIGPSFDTLERLVADSLPQALRVNDARSEYERWHGYARDMVALRGRGEPCQGYAINVRGKAMMDGLRVRVTEFVRVEKTLREHRTVATQRATRLVIGVTAIVSLLVGGVISLVTRRQLIGLSRGYEDALQEIGSLNGRLARRLERIGALHRIDLAITASHDLNAILSAVLDETTSQLGVSAAAVLLLDTQDGALHRAARRGFRGTAALDSCCVRSNIPARSAALKRHLVTAPDLAEGGHGSALAPLPDEEGFIAYYAAPLVANDKVKGVLEVFHRAPLDPDREWLDFLEALAGQAAIAVESVALFEGLQRSNEELKRANDALSAEVGERKRAEDDLKASEKLFRSLSDSSPLGIFKTDAEGWCVYANGRGLSMLGLTLEDTLGHGWSRAVHPDDRAETFASWSAAAGAGREFDREYRVFTPEGVIRWVHARAAALPSGDGGHVGFVATLEDTTERRQAVDEVCRLNSELERRLERIASLRRIDMAITASLDLRVTLNTVLDQVTSQLGVHAAAVLLLDPHSNTLVYAAGRGFRGQEITRSRLRLGEGAAGHAALERRLVHIPDLPGAGDGFARARLAADESFVAYYAEPLVAKGQVKGVLEVFHHEALEPDPEWLSFLETLAGQTAIAVDSASLFDQLQRSNLELTFAYDATIEGWSRALDLRDKETEGHTRRVAEISLRLARSMGMSEAELVHVRRGALLHDIGKMGVPDGILLKPGPLTDDEWVVMRRHPGYAHDWLSPIPYLRPALDIPYCHHEKWDGTGYPRGLKDEQIPLAARVFAAVDIWDALRSDRPYRKGWPEERVLDHIRSLAGTHLDPAVVEAFLRDAQGDGMSLQSDGDDPIVNGRHTGGLLAGRTVV